MTDGALSFVIFLYGDIQWTKASGDDPALAGVNVGDGIRQLNVSESLTEDIINITTTTNVGVPGVWIFQLNTGNVNMDLNHCHCVLQYVHAVHSIPSPSHNNTVIICKLCTVRDKLKNQRHCLQ